MRAAPQLVTGDLVAAAAAGGALGAARGGARARGRGARVRHRDPGDRLPRRDARRARGAVAGTGRVAADRAARATVDAATAALAAALRDLPHSLVDVSHRQGALGVGGPLAVTLLAAGCPLDLDVSAFPPGMCTRTMLAKAEVVLWRTGAESFRLEVWRSFLDYVTAFLAEAARGII